eukprot:552063_1
MAGEKKEIEIDDNDPLFKPKTLFSDNFQHKLIQAKFKNYMDENKDPAKDDEKTEKKSKPKNDDIDDEDDMEQECCIIDDFNNSSAVNYVLNKKDYNEWIINKIMKKTNFDALINDSNKKYIADTDFWKFIKDWCIKKYKKQGNECYEKFVLKAKHHTNKLLTHNPQLVTHLSFDQIAAIHFYTMEHFYRGLNDSLRAGKVDWSPFCGCLSIALYKLPFINFDKNKVYLGFCLSQDKQQSIQYDKGSIMRWNCFTSTTVNKQIAEIYASKDIVFEIESGYHGKDISKFCVKGSDEVEVLFNLSSHFLICDTKIKGNIFYVKLNELPFPWID